MNTPKNSLASTFLAAAVALGLCLQSSTSLASGGSGGGGGGGITAPLPAVPSGSFTMNYVGEIPPSGVKPTCTADFKIRTVSGLAAWNDASLNVGVNSLNVPDGTPVGVWFTVSGYLGLQSCVGITVVGGTGNKNVRFYITGGATITSVVVTDASGKVYFTSN